MIEGAHVRPRLVFARNMLIGGLCAIFLLAGYVVDMNIV